MRFPDGRPDAVLEQLGKIHPRYTCFVARHEEITREFVTRVHQMTRKLDDDPYADTIWGILTGYDASNAEDIASKQQPLIIERVASGTEVALEQCREGIWYCELKQGRMVRKKPGGKPVEGTGPDDTTEALAETLTKYNAQLFVTSGHATERDWQIGFAYRNGFFKCAGGQLFGVDTKGRRIDIQSPGPKVYMPIGNCLMGHIDSQDAMALAWLKSAGVRQMLGYTVPTWYGYAGWGCLDYFVEQPGRFSFSEAYFANQHALIHRLETCFPEIARVALKDPNEAGKMRKKIKGNAAARLAGLKAQDAVGLLFDRDAVVFYGDPAWEARLATGNCAYGQKLRQEGDKYTLLIEPRWGKKAFDPVNTNGSQRGGRPIVAYLPQRVKDIRIVEGTELNPVITDDFILVPNPGSSDGGALKVVFNARPAG
jgi:zinc protease